MFLLCLFAILFSVQCAPHKEYSNLNEVAFSQYGNLLDKVNTYAKFASNFQGAIGEHERLRRSTNDDGIDNDNDHHHHYDITYIPIVVSKYFSEYFQDFILDFLNYLEDEEPVVFKEIELHDVDTIDSDFVVIIAETKEPLKRCVSLQIEGGTGNDDGIVLTVFVNEECAIETIDSWDTTEAPDVWERPTMQRINYH